MGDWRIISTAAEVPGVSYWVSSPKKKAGLGGSCDTINKQDLFKVLFEKAME